MAKKLKKPTKKKTPHGGARKGAGRPATGKTVTGILYIRCLPIAREAIDEYLEGVNSDREDAGLRPISLSRWGTEALLKAAGRRDLVKEMKK